MTPRLAIPLSLLLPALGASSACTTDAGNVVEDTDASGTTSAATDADGTGSSGSGSTDSGSGTGAGTGGTSAGSGTAGGTTGSADDCTGTEGRTIYVNFDGPTLTQGADDPSNDQTGLGQLAMDLEPYAGTDQDAIVATIGTHWDAFDVCITPNRPESGSYDMLVVTATNPFGMGVNGIAPADCADNNGFNIAFTFSAELTAAQIATVGSSVLGTTFGLEKVEPDTDLNFPGIPQDTASFTDACLPLNSGAQCASQHTPFCPDDEQNAFQELLDMLGPAG